MSRILLLAGIILARLAFAPQGAQAQAAVDLGTQPPGRFDFYVLSLTWVPGFCATHRDPEECRRDLGFRLHGLWPESVDGYPTDCASAALPESVREAYIGLFPDPQMIGHEWAKHGTCTGLGPSGFFGKTQSLFGSITVPPAYRQQRNLRPSDAVAVRAAFLAANPNLRVGSIVVECVRRQISEIHICLRKDGSARGCAPWERAEDNCR
jgi:ribonuclease T2